MAEERYNMANIFGNAFGVIPMRYSIDEEADTNPNFDYSGLERVGSEEIISGTSWLGTPINFKFGIKGGSYNYFNAGKIEQREVDDFQFPLTTMVSMSQQNRDRITPVSAGDEAVIELYSFNPWEIRIQGVCVYDPGHPQAIQPADQRRRLFQLKGAADSFHLQEADGLFTDAGVYKLYIRGVNVGQLQGKPNQLPFELTCLSDKPLELRTT